MPEEYVNKLARSRTTNMRHLLPVIQQQVLWPEQKRTVVLIGTRGEVPLAHRKPKEPLLLAVPAGQVVVGYRLAEDLRLDVGEKIQLLGEEFEVAKTQPERGTAEDVTLWIDLAAAQRLLDMAGRVNGIEALKCFCAGVGVDEIRKEVAGILPGTNVILRQNKVTVRAKARARAQKEHEQAIAAERTQRRDLRRSRESFAAMLVPVLVVAAAVWIGLLAIGNVRERVAEIGILRALGVGSSRVFLLFQSRAVLIGLVGALMGCLGGMAAGVILAKLMEKTLETTQAIALLSPLLVGAVLLSAPLLATAASWIPSLMAARQDPAIILSHE
jgi:ABC-type lipoprotein release transport system permease subunit